MPQKQEGLKSLEVGALEVGASPKSKLELGN